MARIVLGLGCSHGPMLSIAPEYWPDRVLADRANAKHFYQGKTYTFDEMAALRHGEGLDAQSSPEVRAERYARCQSAIAKLGDVFADACTGPARPSDPVGTCNVSAEAALLQQRSIAQANSSTAVDIAVVVGNDQMEIFTAEHIPAFAIFWGDYVEGIPRTPEFLAKLPPGIARAELDRTPSEYTRWNCDRGLGRHLIHCATAEGFDVAQMTKLPTGEIGSNAVPHAFGFIYRRVMRDKVPLQVPVLVNTFYPPNQPTASRCYKHGQMLARAVKAWAPDSRVAFIASGGLSHFVVDESFDHAVIDALLGSNAEALENFPESMFESGTSEIKNWIVVAGAMAEAGLKMTLIDYVPCYRSEAGTGSGMGFAYWSEPRQ